MPALEIDGEVLSSAVDELRAWADGRIPAWSTDWQIHRIDRERAVVYELTDPDTGVRLFYKIFDMSVDQTPHSPDSLTNCLDRTKRLNDCLSNRTKDLSVSPAPVLAVDPGQGILVTLGVDGKPLRSGLKYLVQGRKMSSHQAFQLGRACARIEECSINSHVELDVVSFVRKVEHHAHRATTHGHPGKRVKERLLGLIQSHVTDDALVYVHGDLSPSNVLVTRSRVRLIDFSWIASFRGFDVGLLSYRLSYRNRRFQRLRQIFENGPDDLMAGYRNEVGNALQPYSLNAANLYLLLRALGSRSPDTRSIATNRLDAALETVEDPTVFRWWWEP